MRTLATVMLLGCAACSEQTWLVVEVSSELSVPAEIDELSFEVVGLTTGAAGQASFAIIRPWSHSIRVPPAGNEDERVRVTVTGSKRTGAGANLVARRVVESGFEAGTTTTVTVILDAACRGVQCPVGIDCVAGRCVEPPDGGPDAPPPVDGGPDAPPMDHPLDEPSDTMIDTPVDTPAEPPPASGYRRQLTIASSMVMGSANLTDFPLMVLVDDPTLRSTTAGGHVRHAQGYDLRFTAADGSTFLDHEVETYDPSTGHLVSWVRLPTLSASASTVLYVTYGDAAITAPTERATQVWGGTYRTVMHFDEASGTPGTSSSRSAPVTMFGGVTASAAGLFGRAFDFNGVGSRLSIDDGTLPASDPITFELWIRFDSLTPASNFTGLVSKGRESGTAWAGLYETNTNNFAFGSHCSPCNLDGSVLTAARWYYLAGTFDGSDRRIYVDGSLDAGPSAVTNPAIGQAMSVGNDAFNTTYLDGRIDELRVSNTARSAGWIGTVHTNLRSPSTFYTLGAEEIL